jgi:WD40 repeat protein
MVRRFTLAGLLMWVALVALVLAIVVPTYRWRNRSAFSDQLCSLAASADGSTFAAYIDDGRILVWDSAGRLKTTVRTGSGPGAEHLELSSDGKLAAVSGGMVFVPLSLGGNRDAIDVWDVDTGKLLTTVPTTSWTVAGFRFLSRNKFLAVQRTRDRLLSGPAFIYNPAGDLPVPTITINLCPLTEGTPPQPISTPFCVGRFSPDGNRFAGVTKDDEFWIYDLPSSRMTPTLHLPQGIEATDVAWWSNGQGVSLLRMHTDEPANTCWQTVETLPILTAEPEIVELGNKNLQFNATGFFDTITYLPGGRVLALAGRTSPRMLLLDANTLAPLAIEGAQFVSRVAAGIRGDTFVTSGADSAYPSNTPTHVDLWDVATLRPRRRLFEAAKPKTWPAVCGLVVWLAVFVVRCGRRLLRTANFNPSQSCEQRSG